MMANRNMSGVLSLLLEEGFTLKSLPFSWSTEHISIDSSRVGNINQYGWTCNVDMFDSTHDVI